LLLSAIVVLLLIILARSQKNFQIISDIKPDYSPIFVGLSHIRNGSLYCCIGYSSNYTSLDTAETFSDNITNIIEDSSVITF
jgi:hypothetical protein